MPGTRGQYFLIQCLGFGARRAPVSKNKIDKIIIMNKSDFEDQYGPRFQTYLDRLSEEQHDIIMNHIKRLFPDIPFDEHENYYIFNSESMTVEQLKKIWEYICQF